MGLFTTFEEGIRKTYEWISEQIKSESTFQTEEILDEVLA